MKFDTTITLGVIIHLSTLIAVIIGTFWVIRKEVVTLGKSVARMSDWMQKAEIKLVSIDAHIEARQANVLEIRERLNDHEDRLRALEQKP